MGRASCGSLAHWTQDTASWQRESEFSQQPVRASTAWIIPGAASTPEVCLRDSAGCNLRWLKTDTQAVELLAKFPLLPGSLKGSHEPLMWERGFDIVEIMT